MIGHHLVSTVTDEPVEERMISSGSSN
jgi:hypothetical protein